VTTPNNIEETVSLGDLINGIRRSTENELDQLSSAVVVAQHLDEVGDHLIGHFVDQARRAGASWSDIGRSMGVTKQAVQKRFVAKSEFGADAFARFTPRARNAIIAAMQEAHSAHNAEITPAHLILGLLSQPDALAARVLEAQGHEADAIRTAATAATPAPSSEPLPSLIPYGTESVKVLELTAREALRLNHNYIGTEHLLLALLEAEGETGVLTGLGVDKHQVADSIRTALEGAQRSSS
jgi:hypothetical protein